LTDGTSLYDHFGAGFTLLVTTGDSMAAAPFAVAAAARSIPMKVIAPADNRLPARYEAKFLLIRPDQHVAWRGDAIPKDCDALMAKVTGAPPKGDNRVRQSGNGQAKACVANSTEDLIRQLERRRIDALVSKDWETLSSLLADDLVHIHANGTVENKSSYLKTMATQFEVQSVDRPLLEVRVCVDSAIVTGPLNQSLRLIQSGEMVDMRAVATQIWVKRPDGWFQCGFQATRVS